MKTALLFTLLGTAAAFAPLQVTVRKQTALHMSAIAPRPTNDWNDRPQHEEKSTEPKPVRKVSWLKKQTLPDVMIKPDYFLTWAFFLLGPLIIWYHPCKHVEQ